MKTACFIPIKAHSRRVPEKNLRLLCGRKLYEYICIHARQADVFDGLYVDTDSPEVAEYARAMDFTVIPRAAELARDDANGNDLLVHHWQLYPEYDCYFQLFATAPFLQPEAIRACVGRLESDGGCDSCFTAVRRQGFYWMGGTPVNYRPGILPRSQDLAPLLEETTGLYGIRRQALAKYRCRIGRRPYAHLVDRYQAVDINTEEDLREAGWVGRTIYRLGGEG